MKILAFHVTRLKDHQKLSIVIRNVMSLALVKRNKNISNSVMRLEHSELLSGNLLLGDVVKLLRKGPGKAHPERRIEGIKFAKAEKFAAETAFLYDPKLQVILIEYNHSGAREGSIADYFSGFAGGPTAYTFNPIIDFGDQDRWKDSPRVKKLEYSIASLGEPEKGMVENESVAGSIALLKNFMGDGIAVTIKIERKNEVGLDREASQSFINHLKKHIIFGNKKANKKVKKLEVTAENEEAGIAEVIDFITPILAADFELEVGEDLRISRNDRWDALIKAHQAWKFQKAYFHADEVTV